MGTDGVYDRVAETALRRKPVRHVVAAVSSVLIIASRASNGEFTDDLFVGVVGDVAADLIDVSWAVSINLVVIYGFAAVYWKLRNALRKKY